MGNNVSSVWRWNLDCLRAQHRLSIAQIADQSGISRRALYRIENRESQGSVMSLVRLYRSIWHLTGGRTTLHDIIVIDDIPASHPPVPFHPPKDIPPAAPGVWWNVRKLRYELGVERGTQVSQREVTAALAADSVRLSALECGKEIGKVTLLVQLTRYFHRELHRPISLHDVLLVDPHAPGKRREE